MLERSWDGGGGGGGGEGGREEAAEAMYGTGVLVDDETRSHGEERGIEGEGGPGDQGEKEKSAVRVDEQGSDGSEGAVIGREIGQVKQQEDEASAVPPVDDEVVLGVNDERGGQGVEGGGAGGAGEEGGP